MLSLGSPGLSGVPAGARRGAVEASPGRLRSRAEGPGAGPMLACPPPTRMCGVPASMLKRSLSPHISRVCGAAGLGVRAAPALCGGGRLGEG